MNLNIDDSLADVEGDDNDLGHEKRESESSVSLMSIKKLFSVELGQDASTDSVSIMDLKGLNSYIFNFHMTCY